VSQVRDARSRLVYRIAEKSGVWTWSVHRPDGRLMAFGARSTSAQARADAMKFCVLCLPGAKLPSVADHGHPACVN